MKKTVNELLQAKGNAIWSIRPDEMVFEAIRRMAEKNVGALLVMDGRQLIGIISERDYTRKVFLQGKSSKETRVREIMTPNVVCVKPERTVEECMALMTGKHIRHLPVVRDNDVIGVISIMDVIKSIISEKEFIIGQLESYITGR